MHLLILLYYFIFFDLPIYLLATWCYQCVIINIEILTYAKNCNLISMQNAREQKIEMEELKKMAAEENEFLLKRKRVIDAELAEVEPLLKDAKRAVGSIKSESISEIRALRAPPDVIRDIMEAVLRLMGIYDTSWVNMKR